MKNLISRILLPITLIFTLITCSSGSLEDVPTDMINLSVKYNYSKSEIELARLINDYRISKGLNELKLIDYVSYKAEEHNLYMIKNNDVSHFGFKERSDAIIKASGASKVNEIIAYNYSTSQSALKAWMGSPSHKANFDMDFTDFGISVSTDPETGKKYYTIIFAKI